MPGPHKKQKPGASRAAHTAAVPWRPFEHLLRTGLRLNALHDAGELHAFLIDEAKALSGARRVLLLLESPTGLQLAGTLVPRGEDERTLLAAVTPWLVQARRTRVARLRHGPAGAEPVDQRSCLVAPLIAHRELIGCLYADIDGAFGRFDNADRDLLAMLANQAAMALANLRTVDGLQRTVAECTAQLEQRAGELSLIDGIQRGVAAKLDFQAIVDLVGDRLRKVFDTGDLSIRWFDEASNLTHFPYELERGQRLTVAPAARHRVVRSRRCAARGNRPSVAASRSFARQAAACCRAPVSRCRW